MTWQIAIYTRLCARTALSGRTLENAESEIAHSALPSVERCSTLLLGIPRVRFIRTRCTMKNSVSEVKLCSTVRVVLHHSISHRRTEDRHFGSTARRPWMSDWLWQFCTTRCLGHRVASVGATNKTAPNLHTSRQSPAQSAEMQPLSLSLQTLWTLARSNLVRNCSHCARC